MAENVTEQKLALLVADIAQLSKDYEWLRFGAEMDVSVVYVRFVRSDGTEDEFRVVNSELRGLRDEISEFLGES